MDWLGSIQELWLKQAEVCEEVKERQFGDTARRVWRYMGEDYRDLDIEVEGLGEEMPQDLGAHVRTRINKTREFISLMLPAVHEMLPDRMVAPRLPELPEELKALVPNAGPSVEAKMQTWLMQHWLNYLPGEYNLDLEATLCIQEGFGKGRGVIWHEMTDSPSGVVPASFSDTVDGLLIDPDCRQVRDAGYIIRKKRKPVWKLAQQYGYDPDELRGTYESHYSRAQRRTRGERDPRDDGRDVCEYLEVSSRMGVGHHFHDASQELKNLSAALDTLGDNAHLVILPGMKHPLNLHPDRVSEGGDYLKAALQWPLAFHEDVAHPWPCSFLDFSPNTDNPWAVSVLAAGLPLQIFLDRTFTYIMARARASCRDITVVSKGLAKRVKEAMNSGYDQETVETDGVADDIKKHIEVIQFPPLNRDLWEILMAAGREHEKITGLDPMLHGSTPDQTQMRSAQEAQVRDAYVSARPKDYGRRVIAWHSEISRKEAIASRLYVEPATVAPLFGEQPPDLEDPNSSATSPLSYLWAALVNTDDPAEAAAEMSYTCEAGRGTRFNKQKQIADAQVITQSVLPIITQLGQILPPQAILRVVNNALQQLGEAYDIPLSEVTITPQEIKDAELQLQMQKLQQGGGGAAQG